MHRRNTRGPNLRAACALLAGFCSLFGTHPAQGQVREHSVVVAVPTDGEYYVGKDRVARARLAAEVDARLRALGPEDQVVYIKAARSVPYGTLVGIIDELRAMGHDAIGLVADKSSPEDASGERSPAPAPSAESEPPPIPDAVVVKVGTTRGRVQIAVDGRGTTRSRIGAVLRERLQARHVSTVLILAPARMRYDAIVDVIDAAKTSGATTIGLEIDALGGAPSKTPK